MPIDECNKIVISIVTICLNNLEGLKRTFDSIKCQNFESYEWVVVDGCSTDGTVNYLEGLDETALQWKSEPDKGLYDAMNKGIDMSQGQYLLFLNSGDELASLSVLSDIGEIIVSRKKPDIIYGDAYEFDESQTLLLKKAHSHKNIWYGMFTHHQSIFYSNTFVGDTRYLNYYPIGADYGFTAELILKGASLVYYPSVICKFEQGGLSAQNIKQGAIDQFAIRREIFKYPTIVCLLIRLLHTSVRTVKALFPSFHRFIRYSLK